MVIKLGLRPIPSCVDPSPIFIAVLVIDLRAAAVVSLTSTGQDRSHIEGCAPI